MYTAKLQGKAFPWIESPPSANMSHDLNGASKHGVECIILMMLGLAQSQEFSVIPAFKYQAVEYRTGACLMSCI